MFDKRFRKTIREFSMLKAGDRVAIGLSGGKDSCALLQSMVRLNEKLPMELVAITIDEGIKGYREKTLKTAKRECEKHDVEHVVLSFKEAAELDLDEIVKSKKDDIPCSHCGVLRRYLLNKGSREAGANKLATGHNLDDVAQTVFMNIMRNEPARLARYLEPISQSSKFIRRIRPFMRTPEKEIAIYCMVNGIELDNMDCPYAGFAFRGQIRKILNETEEKYPGTKFKILNSFIEMEDALRAKYSVNAKLESCKSCGEPCSDDICMFCKKVKVLK
jgi:uncharacterized protein (TIGR00269 family)